MQSRTNHDTDLVRLVDWEQRLGKWLQQAVNRPFIWGEFDCVIAAAEAMSVQTGHDFTGTCKGWYSTERGAVKRLLKLGYRDINQAMTDAFQSDPVPVCQLQRGDIVEAVMDDEPTVGVIWAGSVWLPDEEGLRPQSLNLASAGWRLLCPQ